MMALYCSWVTIAEKSIEINGRLQLNAKIVINSVKLLMMVIMENKDNLIARKTDMKVSLPMKSALNYLRNIAKT